jgi:glycosyltransferase involved in cell wall biosynthesis
LKDSLKAWAEQDFSKSAYEIIVVDNGSEDNTRPVCKSFEKQYPGINFTYVYQDEPCLSCARNKGIELARGKYVAFVDDDARPVKDYISNLKKHTANYPDIQAFGGRVLPRYETGEEPEWMSKYIQRILSFVDLGDEVKYFDQKYPVGCNMIFRKDIFDEIGVFDMPTPRSDDKQFFLKIKQAGKKVLYLPDVTVYHFIDAWRLTKKYVIKTSCINGCSDAVMYDLFDNKTRLKFFRFADLVFKTFAALVLWGYFSVKGQGIKGKFLFLSMWHTLDGFLSGCEKCNAL